VYSALKNQAKKMESLLQNWINEIAILRNQYHALNYFSTQQLCVIRQSLGQLDCKTITSLPTEIMSMLMSISFKICEKDIVDTMKAFKSEDSRRSVGASNDSILTQRRDLYSDEDHKIAQIIPENEVNIESAIEKKLMVLVNELSDVHQEVFEEVRQGFNSNLVYLGIKHCSIEESQTLQVNSIVEKVCEWCVDNEAKYKKMDRRALLKEMDSGNYQILEHSQIAVDVNPMKNDSSTDSVEHCHKSNVQGSSELNTSITNNTDFASIRKIEEELISYDIPSGIARKAIEKGYTSIEEALDYCLELQISSSSNQLVQSVVTCSQSTMHEDIERYCFADLCIKLFS